MRNIPFYQVDAFTGRVFGGNPAAVCVLDAWLDDERLQQIAAENNLSETAFLVARGADYELRWMTPTVEVDLCGHATLAAGYVVLRELESARDVVRFHTRSGPLSVARDGEAFRMDLPACRAAPCEPPDGLEVALGKRPVEVLAYQDQYVAVLAEERDVRDLAPDIGAIERIAKHSVCVTAPGDEIDFVSRFFAPAVGVPEDPVTGSAHCLLTPYWAKRLGKTRLSARQLSKRGGDLACEDRGAVVRLWGAAVLYARGEVVGAGLAPPDPHAPE